MGQEVSNLRCNKRLWDIGGEMLHLALQAGLDQDVLSVLSPWIGQDRTREIFTKLANTQKMFSASSLKGHRTQKKGWGFKPSKHTRGTCCDPVRDFLCCNTSFTLNDLC